LFDLENKYKNGKVDSKPRSNEFAKGFCPAEGEKFLFLSQYFNQNTFPDSSLILLKSLVSLANKKFKKARAFDLNSACHSSNSST